MMGWLEQHAVQRVPARLRRDPRGLDAVARRIRGHVVMMVHRASAAHLAPALSCVDILVAAYWRVLAVDPARPDDPARDRLIFSNGQAAAALYAALAERGFFPSARLETYGMSGSLLGEHPARGCAPGVEATTGSPGHGLPVGVGTALAGRLHHRPYRTYVSMSDGECSEGSVWEAALLAPAHRLERLAVIIDHDASLAKGRGAGGLTLDPLRAKWEAFGWSAKEIDGHDLPALVGALAAVPDGSGRPVAIVAHTTRGKGVSFVEGNGDWHHRVPSAAECAAALQELGLR